MKKYCFHQGNSANDKKFLTSLDKLIRKEKKKMEADGNTEEWKKDKRKYKWMKKLILMKKRKKQKTDIIWVNFSYLLF